MKKPRLSYSKSAREIVKRLPPNIKPSIKHEIENLLPNPHAGKELTDELNSFRSLAIGKYRIIYRLNDDHETIEIHFIGHRRDVYANFKEMLKAIKR